MDLIFCPRMSAWARKLPPSRPQCLLRQTYWIVTRRCYTLLSHAGWESTDSEWTGRMTEQITKLLHAAEGGDLEAQNRLFERVYADLRTMASQWLAREKAGHTLQPSALVNEVYLRIFRRARTDDDAPRRWEGRRHFFAAAANAMRQILVDAARRKTRVKRGGDFSRIATPIDM